MTYLPDGEDLCEPCRNDTINGCVGERAVCALDATDGVFRCACPDEFPAMIQGNCCKYITDFIIFFDACMWCINTHFRYQCCAYMTMQ